jgi:hypothetical protein
MKTLGYLISCQGRQLFMRDAADCSWAYLDDEYTVTELVARVGDDVPNALPATTDDTIERMQILEQLYELEELQIAEMKSKLEEAVELAENIHLFASNQTTNIMEARGLLRLIAESCDKWLKPKE